MAVENPPFDIYPGESKELLVTVEDTDDSSESLDMTNARFIWELYQEPNHIKLLSKDNTGADVFLLDSVNNIVQVNINSTDTANLQLGKIYAYYLRVIDKYNKVTVVSKSGINVKN